MEHQQSAATLEADEVGEGKAKRVLEQSGVTVLLQENEVKIVERTQEKHWTETLEKA